MRPLTPRAPRQLDDLIAHYEELDRDQAIANLRAALINASRRIEVTNGQGLPAPTPYPEIARLNLGFRWLKIPPYWFAFTPPPSLIITAILYERSNLPNRI